MEQKRLTLAEISAGKNCVITKTHGHGGFRHRLLEMGFIRGEKVHVIKNAPMLDPIEYEVMGNHVSLRRAEAALIEVIVTSETANDVHTPQSETLTFEDTSETLNRQIREESHTIRVALVGNPNCGKTSFFNHSTGLREKVGNYGGVTVESKFGQFHHKGYTIEMTDLPGTYSLTAYTPEERYVRQFLTEQQPDIILNIVDASNLERNLLLTTQLIDMNQPMVMALNMYDELQKSDAKLNYKQLSNLLGFPIVPTVSSRGTGIETLLDSIIDIFENKPGLTHHIHINYGQDIEKSIRHIRCAISSTGKNDKSTPITQGEEEFPLYPNRYTALKLLEGDQVTRDEIAALPTAAKAEAEALNSRTALEKEYKQNIADIIAEAKYGFIRGALKETFTEGETAINQKSYAVDKILTHKWLGFPVLLLFLWIMFEATFTLGAYPQDWIEAGIEWLGETVRGALPAGTLSDLIVDGIIAGVGGVIVFLPNILILFFFISLLEDTGYMARAAFIMDKMMHKIGLHGKSFIPYLIGFGCGVPAIMATRTLASRKDRIITILTVPFMSCSARLPVYLLFVSAFFAANQGLVLLSIYLIGIVVAVLTALLLRHTLFAEEEDQFVMELPPYRMPTLRNSAIHMWDKSLFYLKKMGTVILVASIIVWALGYFPQDNEHTRKIDSQIEQVEASSMDKDAKAEQVAALELQQKALQSEHSYIGRLGHFIEPAVSPLGFDWKMGVSILTGLGAKEIVVSSMGILYQADGEADEESESLISSLQAQRHTSGAHKGEPVFTPIIAYAFMLFVLLYFPCIAALSAIRKEAGGKWAMFSMVYTTVVAWIVAFAVVHIGGLFI